MKSSHIAIICIVLLSFFSMYECSKIGRSRKINVPLCFHSKCYNVFKPDCWCCLAAGTKKDDCWLDSDYPNAKEICFKSCIR
ncbi:PREDICTED: EMBRYO SURROUNDING FACTOR 1-like protein 2 [Camelina sativa]|uniref:EMBRYO SURROUNDING FACTOR 1-like protein 2 n=1 Tax=Camelina sativa TaxID=90675 RepID=A0ABM1QGN9_CAMSA|nr:PREDICTED: EMBRYO SURROUNDING FACTOR 1-like protein 2 [Camelina sativa]